MSNARNIARLLANTNGELQQASIPSIPTSKLTGSIPAANQTAGSVIQTLYWENKNNVSTTSTAYDCFNVTVTPKSSNSRFLITADMKASHTQSVSLYFQIGINDDFSLASGGRSYPSATGSIYMEAYGNSHSSNAQINQYIAHYMYTQTSGSPFNVKIRAHLQSSTMYLNYAFSYDDDARGRPMSTLHIMEIL